MIEDRDIASLTPGETTRADVLLRFGDPTETFDSDEFFCYRWERVQGWLVVAGGAGPYGTVHCFCAQFSVSNVYVRGKHTTPFALFPGDESDGAALPWNEESCEAALTKWGHVRSDSPGTRSEP